MIVSGSRPPLSLMGLQWEHPQADIHLSIESWFKHISPPRRCRCLNPQVFCILPMQFHSFNVGVEFNWACSSVGNQADKLHHYEALRSISKFQSQNMTWGSPASSVVHLVFHSKSPSMVQIKSAGNQPNLTASAPWNKLSSVTATWTYQSVWHHDTSESSAGCLLSMGMNEEGNLFILDHKAGVILHSHIWP